MKFRKKPVVIEAFRYGVDPIPDWFMDRVSTNEIIMNTAASDVQWKGEGTCTIKTLEGAMNGDYGDWIIQGIKGEIYPCKPDIFDATYEPVEEDT